MATLRTLILAALLTMLFSYMMIAQIGFYELTTNTLNNQTLRANLIAVIGNTTNSTTANPSGTLFGSTETLVNQTYDNASQLKNLNPVSGVFQIVSVATNFLINLPEIYNALSLFISIPVVYFIPALSGYAIIIGQAMLFVLIFMALVSAILLFPN